MTKAAASKTKSKRAAKRATRRQSVEQKERTIIRAAHDAFVAEGYEGARMAEIARRAGVAEGTVYLYFANKQALLDAVLAEFYAGLTRGAAQGIARIEAQGTFAQLEFLARHHLENCLKSWRLFTLTAQDARYAEAYRATQVYRLNREYVTVFDQVLREGIARGDIRAEVSLTVLRDLFYGGLDYALRSALLHERSHRATVQSVIPAFMAMIAPGLVPAGQPAAPDTAATLQRLETLAARLEQALDKTPKR